MSDNQRSTDDFDHMLGLRIRSRRLEIGMSQEALAEIIGVTFQQIQKYEKGINRVAAGRLFAISEALGLSIADLVQFAARHEGKANSPFSAALATPDGVHLLSLFGLIDNSKVRDRVIELVRAIAREDSAT